MILFELEGCVDWAAFAFMRNLFRQFIDQLNIQCIYARGLVPDVRYTLSCFENPSASGANTSGRHISFKSMIQAYHLSKQ